MQDTHQGNSSFTQALLPQALQSWHFYNNKIGLNTSIASVAVLIWQFSRVKCILSGTPSCLKWKKEGDGEQDKGTDVETLDAGCPSTKSMGTENVKITLWRLHCEDHIVKTVAWHTSICCVALIQERTSGSRTAFDIFFVPKFNITEDLPRGQPFLEP